MRQVMRHAMRQVRRARGFTLIEVLVALTVMAILATLTWQGLDGILRARDGSREALERSQRMGTLIAQWEQDLEALVDTQAVPALHFDGQTVRITRRTSTGVVLVAWSLRSGRWQRWVSPAVTRVVDLTAAWQDSQALLGNEAGNLVLAEGVTQWQVYFHRGGSWTNAQSTGDFAAPQAPSAPASGASAPAAPAAGRELLPAAVRMVIAMPAGTITRDVLLGPTGAGA
jgi:general secretion pathway protein J